MAVRFWCVGFDGAGLLGGNYKLTAHCPRQILNDVALVAAGYGHTLALKNDSSLRVAGLNNFGQLGNRNTGSLGRFESVLKGIREIGAGYYHSPALSADGRIWTAGRNGRGRLGTGPGSTDRNYFEQVIF